MKKESLEGITVGKEKDFSEWYIQVIKKAELADYSKVSGIMVIRPNAYYIWERIQDHINKKIQNLGVKNSYFPLLIPEHLLNKEKEHIKGFSPEVAWVTKAGNTKLKEKLAIRPTSETIIYDFYKKWIRNYKDLPLKLNQWGNVIRWEFKHPIPFLRTREFLWQEGHTAFVTKKESDKEVKQILDVYANVYEELLAIPVLKGIKSEKEKFAGALYTLSVETLLPNGKAIQGATSHSLGQNFSKAFNITFLDKDEKSKNVWQNSWGLSTRSIGIMIMMHSDDKGLILPPNVAFSQVVIVPIIFKKDKENVLKKAKELKSKLKSFNPILDDRIGYSPGWKFNEWELKGIPIRIEIGPRDVKKNQVVVVRRDTLKKEVVKFGNVNNKTKDLLEDIQNNLFRKASKFLRNNIIKVNSANNLKSSLKKGKIVMINWCNTNECEEDIKFKNNGAKSLNIVLDKKVSGKCSNCKRKAEVIAYFAKSY